MSIPEIEHKNNADKVVAQNKEDVPSDTGIGATLLVNGRKRLNNSFFNEHEIRNCRRKQGGMEVMTWKMSLQTGRKQFQLLNV